MKKLLLFIFIGLLGSAQANTIAEKKAKLTHQGGDLSPELQRTLKIHNSLTEKKKLRLAEYYREAETLYRQKASPETFQELLEKINLVRTEINELQKEWRGQNVGQESSEGYALWHQPETTLSQLVIDYGSHDHVYLFTQDIATMKINVASNLPVPRASWDEVLELILAYNGVGVRQLNPYVRQLYPLNDDKSALHTITNQRQDLQLLPPSARVCYVLSPQPSEAKRIWLFLEKFANNKTTSLHMIGRDIFVVASVTELQDLLKLYDFAANNRGDKEYKIVTLRRVKSEEMAKILGAVFDQFAAVSKRETTRGKPQDKQKEETTGLRVITLGHISQSLFLVGTTEEIKKAEEIVREVEHQVGDAKEKVIHWYTTKHSDVEELATVLAKVYQLLSKNPTKVANNEIEQAITQLEQGQADLIDQHAPAPGCQDPCFEDCGYVWDSSPKEICNQRSFNKNRNNFIVDPKTGAIVMVVEASILPRMKELIKKLDVPKKMVQIEVLLFEKRIKKETDFGLNLLKLGDAASKKHESGARWNEAPGIFEYFLSRTKSSSFPAFDLVYKFLMTRDDVQINATPSVVTMNQTPAKIDIEEEISVKTGVYQVDTTGGVTLKDAFQRARYGIKIEITPTIHMNDEMCQDGEVPYVTLDTNVVFETIQKGEKAQQPDVIRRLINNKVRVPDGQTVILGGLRKKTTEDRKESIPFVGELPGIGKLFSITEMEDKSTEMFMFITPKIISDPSEDFERIRTQELCRRPGDIPLFIAHLQKARDRERKQMMSQSMDMLFGRLPPRIEIPCGEYDGRAKCR